MKSFFLPLTEPLGAMWLVMVGATAWLLIRRRWRSGFWLGIPTLVFFLLGSTPLAEALVVHAEAPCASSTVNSQLARLQSGAAAWDAVVVLGGGFYPSTHDFQGFVFDAGASRLVAGIELARQGRGACLVLGGSLPLTASGDAYAVRLQEWVGSLGQTNFAITNLGICRDTHDEAVAFKQLQQAHHWRNILLVTSALHLPRAEALFRKQGIPVTPVACDFRACGVSRPEFLWFSPFPRIERLGLLSFYFHEKVGWWVYRVRGWI